MYIDIEKAKKEFVNYAKNYDLNDPMIDLKLNHSLRVMVVANRLANMMNLNEEDIEIATIIGLLHDIARFEQYTQYKTFRDVDSRDHGDWGIEILDKDMRKYVETNKYDLLIKTAIKNHNKFEIENGLDERTLFFCKLIRDADKLDILYEATFMFWKNSVEQVNNSELNQNAYNDFLKHKLIKRVKGENYDDFNKVITTTAFIFDINFKESFEILYKEDYLNKIINRFNYKRPEIQEKIRQEANDYIKNKVGIN
ncbi:MAG: HD domain-containing protein [Clostridia bacterium]|nr:HD domain-containing protein [Clostridia bacterium]